MCQDPTACQTWNLPWSSLLFIEPQQSLSFLFLPILQPSSLTWCITIAAHMLKIHLYNATAPCIWPRKGMGRVTACAGSDVGRLHPPYSWRRCASHFSVRLCASFLTTLVVRNESQFSDSWTRTLHYQVLPVWIDYDWYLLEVWEFSKYFPVWFWTRCRE